MTIYLYSNGSPTNYVKKSLSESWQLDGYLREPCSVVDPTMIIETTIVPTNYNYAYIPQFGRYYFVTEWVQESQNRWRISMHCDVLSTYWSKGLSTSSCVVGRNSYKRQDDLVDEQMYFTADSLYSIYDFPSTPFSGSNGSYVLILAGSN